MDYPKKFISATKEYCTFEKHVSAPYLRKSFTVDEKVSKADIIICGLGFYDLYINGKRITKGILAPYISNPDDIIYYDSYDITKYLVNGENVIGIILGNGMQNCLGGRIWEFDDAVWRSAPKTALKLTLKTENDTELIIEADESFKIHPSAITFDDLRMGEHYDATKEVAFWNLPGFNDNDWDNAVFSETPRGEAVLCEIDPIVVSDILKPVSVTEQDGGYLYDFGVNSAGLCTLNINGESGQTVILRHFEHLIDGKPDYNNIGFEREDCGYYKDYNQKVSYICKGGNESYTPSFTYFGFRYVLVSGITKEQAASDLLTFNVMNSKLSEVGSFKCSDETINKLQEFTRRSSLANFYYFPTDCPHREKNGWTGDAALSAEHMLLNLSTEQYFKEWLRNIRKAQAENGALPGIVPTSGWGFEWGNGPAWDCVLIYLPYYVYIYRGDKEILSENAGAIYRYVTYLSNNIRKDGLISLGLGDWCTPDRVCDDYKSPIELTDSIISMDICQKAAKIFNVLGMSLQEKFAASLKLQLRESIRKELIDFDTMTAKGNCQTSQAMILYYDILEEAEKQQAFSKLLEIISESGNKMDTGILGARVIFHVLSEFSKGDLAFEMITTPEFPSYGNWIARGATALWEDFRRSDTIVSSQNHHFFGDISNWFITKIAGIQLNPDLCDTNSVNICPDFITSLNYAEAYHICPSGKIEVKWNRIGDEIKLDINIPDNMNGNILLKNGFTFEDGTSCCKIKSSIFSIRY